MKSYFLCNAQIDHIKKFLIYYSNITIEYVNHNILPKIWLMGTVKIKFQSKYSIHHKYQ